MILDHQTTGLLADHGPDWTEMLGRVAAGLRRWLDARRPSKPTRNQEISNVGQL